jgi:DNA-binding CsgD family transcriptional regulator
VLPLFPDSVLASPAPGALATGLPLPIGAGGGARSEQDVGQLQLFDAVHGLLADLATGATVVLVLEIRLHVEHRDGLAVDPAPPAQLERPALPAADDQPFEPLTRREREVLVLIAAGLSNREIAERLVLTEATIKQYLKHVYAKLGVSNRTEAALHPRARGLRNQA